MQPTNTPSKPKNAPVTDAEIAEIAAGDFRVAAAIRTIMHSHGISPEEVARFARRVGKRGAPLWNDFLERRDVSKDPAYNFATFIHEKNNNP